MATQSHFGFGIAAVFLLSLASQAHAQDLGVTVDPRSIGRAGTSTVSSDSGTALIINPGAMVRRSQARLLVSTQITDSDLSFGVEAVDIPTSVNRAKPTSAPLVAYHQGNDAGTWVLGIVLMSGSEAIRLADPAFGQPPEDIAALFPHRYGGISYENVWRRLALGGALRIGESLGIGVSASVSQREIRETRRIWAGFGGRDSILNPNRDLGLAITGSDSFIAGASAGLLLAPPEVPLEFALSGEFLQGATLTGTALLSTTQSSEFPRPENNSPTSRLKLLSSIIVHTGMRYLGKRSFIEVGADFHLQSSSSQESWSLQGLGVVDDSTVTASVDSAPAFLHTRDHVVLKAAYDYEIITGYLWSTVGYAWASPTTAPQHDVPVFAGLGGHTLAFGVEAIYENFLLTVGYSRHLEAQRDSDAIHGSQVINPFQAGSGPSSSGAYSTSADNVGFSLERSWF